MNTRQRLSISFPEHWYTLSEFNSRKNCQQLTKWTKWNKRDKARSSTTSFFKRRFRSRHCRCSYTTAIRKLFSPIGHNNTKQFFVPNQEPAFAWPFGNDPVRVGTQASSKNPGAVSSRAGRKGETNVFARTCKLLSRLFRPDWLPLGLRGWYPGALPPVLENFCRAFSSGPTDCPWVS